MLFRSETIGKILVPTKSGAHVPLTQVAHLNYVRGPQVVKSEDTFLVGYVLFDMKPDNAEVDVVEECQRYLKAKIDSGEFILPKGISYVFAGNYENQVRSQKTLMVVLPVALFIIFMILYFQFHSVITTSLVFSGILVAWSGGFLMIWLYAQPWFLNFSVFGTDMQTLFQIHPINLSIEFSMVTNVTTTKTLWVLPNGPFVVGAPAFWGACDDRAGKGGVRPRSHRSPGQGDEGRARQM